MATTTKTNATKDTDRIKDTVNDTVKDASEGVQRMIESLEKNEKSALDAVKRFVDAVNDAFPDISEDGPRRQIIDAAFKMTEQVVEASNRMASSVVDVTGGAVENLARSAD